MLLRGLCPASLQWVTHRALASRDQLLCSSFILFTLEFFAPLLGSGVRYSWHGRRLMPSLLRMSMSCTKCLNFPSCLTHPTRSIHSPFPSSQVTIPHGQGRCAPPTSSNPWPQHPLLSLGGDSWLAHTAFAGFVCLFVCLPHTFVCCLPAELFSACIQSVGWPAPLLDSVSFTCKPAEAAWFSWQIPSTARTIPKC